MDTSNLSFDDPKLEEVQVHREADIHHLLYFPTSIFAYNIPDSEHQNSLLLEAIYGERDRDREGIKRSNFPELGGWHSHNNLQENKKFDGLVYHVNHVAEFISKSKGYHDRYKLFIDSMWSIINSPGSFNQSHIHPGSLWSGVYYVQAPKNSGNIEFIDPRTQNLVRQPRYLPDTRRPESCWTRVKFKPRAGKMLLFPSWLYHSVMPNMSNGKEREGERVILSFNLSQTKQETP